MSAAMNLAAHKPNGQIWVALRDEFAQRASRGRCSSAAGAEWARLSQASRMCLVLLAGIDGDMDVLAGRAWDEIPAPEQNAIKQAARGLANDLCGVYALRGR